MLKRMELHSTCRPVEVLRHWRSEGQLQLNPPYQRGDVWGIKRRCNLIRSILLGVPIPSLIMNDRMRAEWADDYSMVAIDGKQRITAILMFFDSCLAVPAEWFTDGTGSIVYEDLPIVDQRKFHRRTITVAEGALKTLDEEREVFELVNFGGVPQGESDE